MASELWQRIRAVRKHMQLNQEAFGAHFSVSKAAVSQWESASPSTRTRPVHETLQKIAKISKAPLDWLLSDESDCDPSYWAEEPTIPAAKVAPISDPPHVQDPALDFVADDRNAPESISSKFRRIEELAFNSLSDSLPSSFALADSNTMFADFSVIDRRGGAVCNIEVKTLLINKNRVMSTDIDRLLGFLWRAKHISQREVEIPKPMALLLVLRAWRDEPPVHRVPFDVMVALQAAVEYDLIFEYAIVGLEKTPPLSFYDLPNGMTIDDVGRSTRISKIAEKIAKRWPA